MRANAVFSSVRTARSGVAKWVIRGLRSTFPIGLSEAPLICWVGILLSFLCVLCRTPSPPRRTREAVNPPQSTPLPHRPSLSPCTHPSCFSTNSFWRLRRMVAVVPFTSRNLRGRELPFANLAWMGRTADWMSFSHQAAPSRPAGEGGGYRERGVMLE